ncbi:MAG: hypothetical protein RJB01_798 [Actinomycetota bacterium]|jgi:hypothetical protein
MEAFDRQALTDRIVEQARTDESFRARLMADPKATLEDFLGMQLPDQVRVHVVEESFTDVYLVLPYELSAELNEEDLEAVSGGMGMFS